MLTMTKIHSLSSMEMEENISQISGNLNYFSVFKGNKTGDNTVVIGTV